MQALEGLLDRLCCPVQRSPLALVDQHDLRLINVGIAGGRARYADGAPVTEVLDGGLATVDGSSLYRIEDGVPVLVQGLRILRLADAQQVSETGPPTQISQLADVWLELSRRWGRINPPLRPAPQDIELFERLVDTVAQDAGPAPRVLLLGVTPEIATMRWPAGTRLLALDSSPAMIRTVWPAGEARDAVVARADWKAMPVRDGACDVVIGDGILTSQRFPNDVLALASEVRRVVKDSGAFVMRLFARPETNEPLGGVFQDLRAGRIPNFDVFHWRLAMAVHRDTTSGTRLGDVWEAWQENVPMPAELLASLGWAPDAARILETYRSSATLISFPTVVEVRDTLAQDFDQTACHIPEYESGDRYPTVLFRPRRHSARRDAMRGPSPGRAH
ncbi:MAG: methyltransferase domain-containing protein [Acidobacteriia bacterium]|nr:methyltransferase domain-containing protein [Terriglobia bacterium]